jgi:hypothetical protein
MYAEMDKYCLAQAFIGGMLRMYGHFVRQIYVHASEDKEEIVQSLNSHGISRSGLPCFIGESWSYGRFPDWLAERIQMDREWLPEHSFPAAPEDAATLAAFATTSGDGAYTSCRAEYGYDDDDVLNLSSNKFSPTGGAASLLAADGDGSVSGVIIRRHEM